MKTPVTVEICVDSIASAMAAEQGGAQRIELCSNLGEGGTTPSVGLIECVREKTGTSLYVLIRPRAGDFCYSDDEFAIMKRDVALAKRVGADGVAIGILKEDGRVDVQRTRCLVELARPLGTTFHRAFDMSADLNVALEDVVGAGVERVLTSGGEQRAEDSIATIAKLVAAAGDRIKIMVGGGIRPANVRRVLAETRAREIHANLGSAVASPMLHRNERISMGAIKGREYERIVVSAERVRELVEAATKNPSTFH